MDPTKWERIVTEAATAFGRYGFRKTSMDDIARAAGVAKGTLYLGCRSKRDLFYQAIMRDMRRWHAALAEVVDPRVPADDLLVSVSTRAIAILGDYPLAHGLIRDDFAADLPDWLEHLDDLRAQGVSTVLDLLRLGVRQGRFRAELDLEEVAQVFLDLITTTVMFHARGAAAEERLRRHEAAVFDLVLKGVLRSDVKRAAGTVRKTPRRSRAKKRTR